MPVNEKHKYNKIINGLFSIQLRQFHALGNVHADDSEQFI